MGTVQKRPELLKNAELTEDEKKWINEKWGL